jgi:hypothetical protein
MSRSSALAVAGATAALIIMPASASAAVKSCGTAKGVGNGISVTRVTTTSGSCVAAKTVAKSFARTRVAPAGFTCKERVSGPLGAVTAQVRCTRPGRTITFKVLWTSSLPLPAAPALPSANGGGEA